MMGLIRFSRACGRRVHRWGLGAIGLVLTATAAAQDIPRGIPGELPLPLQYVDTARGGVAITPHFSSGGHPISLLDTIDAPGAASASSSPLRVLFIGNSLTYYNAMARMFAALAATGMHRRIVVGVAAYPGASMDVLWRGTDAREVIRRLPWDYVVLQPRLSSADSATFAGDTRLFYQEIAARRARPVVWEQYWSDALTRADQARLDAGIGAAARGMHATVAHVPEAWEAVRQADAGLWHRLFESDGHPTPTGSYLTALAVYRAIAGQSPVGLPRAAGATLFSQRDVDLLQRAAASTP